MLYCEYVGMEGLSAKVGEPFLRPRRHQSGFGAESSPIGLIAHKRMANRGQMHANLVSSAGFQPAPKKACRRFGRLGPAALGPLGLVALAAFGRFRLAGVALQHLPVGHGLAATGADRHPVAGLRIAVDRHLDHPMGPLRRTPDEGQVAALEWLAAAPVIGELRGKSTMGAIVLGDDHQTGRVLIEPVNDARPPLSADAREAIPAMGNKRIDQRPGPAAGGWADHEVFRLVDDNNIVVLVHGPERYWLGGV